MPTTNVVRGVYILASRRIDKYSKPEEVYAAEFDRWLSSEQRAVWQEAIEYAHQLSSEVPDWMPSDVLDRGLPAHFASQRSDAYIRSEVFKRRDSGQ